MISKKYLYANCQMLQFMKYFPTSFTKLYPPPTHFEAYKIKQGPDTKALKVFIFRLSLIPSFCLIQRGSIQFIRIQQTLCHYNDSLINKTPKILANDRNDFNEYSSSYSSSESPSICSEGSDDENDVKYKKHKRNKRKNEIVVNVNINNNNICNGHESTPNDMNGN